MPMAVRLSDAAERSVDGGLSIRRMLRGPRVGSSWHGWGGSYLRGGVRQGRVGAAVQRGLLLWLRVSGGSRGGRGAGGWWWS